MSSSWAKLLVAAILKQVMRDETDVNLKQQTLGRQYHVSQTGE